MAMGVPIVTTPIGCEGLEIQKGIHAFIEERPEGLAEKILALLKGEVDQTSLVREARAYVENKHDKKKLQIPLD